MRSEVKSISYQKFAKDSLLVSPVEWSYLHTKGVNKYHLI